jgi:hypothetical protein
MNRAWIGSWLAVLFLSGPWLQLPVQAVPPTLPPESCQVNLAFVEGGCHDERCGVSWLLTKIGVFAVGVWFPDGRTGVGLITSTDVRLISAVGLLEQSPTACICMRDPNDSLIGTCRLDGIEYLMIGSISCSPVEAGITFPY